MCENVFVRENLSVRRNCERLYIDAKTSDVNFIFAAKEADNSETIPAHKILLSVISPVFDAMFYGSLVKEREISIVEASAEAFKEFLQFFYLSKVRLTVENIGEVVNLCNKYELLDGLKACESPLQNSLTNNDMCRGYEVATILGLDNLRRFCECKIQENAQEILTSETFLVCDRKSVEKILELIESRCGSLVIVKACMEWAKAECERRNLEKSSANLRLQLGNLFTILFEPFGELSIQHFFNYTAEYRDFFSDSEIELILKRISTKTFQSSVFGDCSLSILPELICDRRTSASKETEIHEMQYAYCSLESNKTVLLKEFYLPQLATKTNPEENQTLDVFYTLYGPFNCLRGEYITFGKVKLSSKQETKIILPQPAIIEGCKGYCLNIIGTHYDLCRGYSFVKLKHLEKIVRLDNEIEIKFYPGSLISPELVFLQPTIRN